MGKELTLKMDGTEWEVSSTNRDNAGNQNWHCSAKFNGFSVMITVPIEDKMTRAKVLLYIEHVHEAMKAAWKAQDIHQYFQHNKH